MYTRFQTGYNYLRVFSIKSSWHNPEARSGEILFFCATPKMQAKIRNRKSLAASKLRRRNLPRQLYKKKKFDLKKNIITQLLFYLMITICSAVDTAVPHRDNTHMPHTTI